MFKPDQSTEIIRGVVEEVVAATSGIHGFAEAACERFRRASLHLEIPRLVTGVEISAEITVDETKLDGRR